MSLVYHMRFQRGTSNTIQAIGRGVPGGTSGKYVPDGIERFIPKPEPAFFHEISDHRGLQRTFKLVKIFKIYGNS